MRALTEAEILSWIEGTAEKNEATSITKARFEKAFGLGTPKDIYKEMERSFDQEMVLWAMKKGKLNDD
ncbi:MAG: hypothetical protein Q8K33_03440 [Cypionkella sp.]|uniref:hypothetical protein n=1 Tax=Cypionkella sp. TaxID=2811411 RepID=UPI00272F896A|nr:hypothetical protein [Cypionkella sp.]MDP2047934.1 hypothetical protein [Cypionkella sp.]